MSTYLLPIPYEHLLPTLFLLPLHTCTYTQIEVIKLADNWKGFIRIGLTTCVPDSFSLVPSLSTLLPPYTWVVNGSTVTENGTTVTETYGAALCRIQVTKGYQLLQLMLTLHPSLAGHEGCGKAVVFSSQNLYLIRTSYLMLHSLYLTSG